MKFWFTLFLCAFCAIQSNAQLNRYRVQLKHKGATTHQLSNPSAYLSQKAIERREKFQIPIDSADLPIPSIYIQEIQSVAGVTILNQSKWLNAVSVRITDPAAISTLLALPYVESVEGIAARTGEVRRVEEEMVDLPAVASRSQNLQDDYYDYGANSFAEIKLHNGQFLHNIGLRGAGVQIAMLDGGFRNYNTLAAFDSMNLNNRVLSTWDFVDKHSSVAEDHQHGMQCLSTIATNLPGQFVGKAPEASFHLYRTEDASSEFPIEEFNWVCGAERADSIGADIISSSLGYGYEWSNPVADYPYSYLNGDITMAARGADRAAAKGLLVFNSAGNAGNSYWKMITTPADGDSVVAVGAVNNNGVVGSFSSYGPSADGRVKPDLASAGVAAMVINTNGAIGASNGTSFAGPNLAGLAACLWQGFPEVSNMRIIDALKKSANQYLNPDDRIGYGIPDMKKTFASLLLDFVEAEATLSNCTVNIRWKSKEAAGMKYIIERRLSNETGFSSIAEINATANRNLQVAQHQYELSLEFTGVEAAHFRIRQVLDTTADGYYEITLPEVSVSNINCPVIDRFSVQVMGQPNLAQSAQVRLKVDSPEEKQNLRLQVYSSNGQLVHSQTLGAVMRGSSVIVINPFIGAAGIYRIVVYEGNKIVARSPLVQL